MLVVIGRSSRSAEWEQIGKNPDLVLYASFAEFRYAIIECLQPSILVAKVCN